MRTTKGMGSIIIAALLLATLLAACGYENPYLAARRQLEGSGSGTISLYTSIWANRTNELGLGLIFYNALHNWFQNSQRLELQDDLAAADYELTGEILSLEEGITRGTVRLAVGYLLRNVKTGEVVWQVARQVFSENYYIADSPVETRDNKRQALEKIADELAESIYVRILQSGIGKTKVEGNEGKEETPTEAPSNN